MRTNKFDYVFSLVRFNVHLNVKSNSFYNFVVLHLYYFVFSVFIPFTFDLKLKQCQGFA